MDTPQTQQESRFWYCIRIFIQTFYLHITNIFSLLLIFLLFLNFQQGIDVVIQVGEHPGPFTWTLICILLWAFLTWYSARLLSYAKQYGGSDIPGKLHKHIPRLLAFNCLVALQTAIFSLFTMQNSLELLYGKVLPDIYYLHGIGVFVFIVIHNGLYFLFTALWENPGFSGRAWVKGIAWGISGIYLLLIGLVLYVHRYCAPWQKHVYVLPCLALILFGAELLAIWLFIQRRNKIDIASPASEEEVPLPSRYKPIRWLYRKIGIREDFKVAEKNAIGWFGAIVIGALIIYGLAIGFTYIADCFGPAAMLFSALGILAIFLNLVSYFSILLKFNLHIIFWIWAILLGIVKPDPYTVKAFSTGNRQTFVHRPTIKEHLVNWMKERDTLLSKSMDDSFQVYIVLSDGGGSLSGNWTASLLTKIQDSSYHAPGGRQNSFSDHLLCIAGASGGTIGNIVFYSLLKEQRFHDRDSLYRHARDFFSTDLLSYTLGHLLGPDVFRHVLPFTFPIDRARALELAMIHTRYDTLTGNLLGQKLDAVFDYTGRMPALFINSTHVEDGMPGVISSVQLPYNSQRIDMLGLLDSINGEKCMFPQNIQLATAGVLSSRFPYVSPAGNLKGEYFVDGGYFDNSGAGIVLEYMQDLQTLFDADNDPIISKYHKKLHFNIIQIVHGLTAAEEKKSRIHPAVNDLAAPVLTLAGMQNSSTAIGNGLLRAHLLKLNKGKANGYMTFNLFEPVDKEDTYPMSWVISDYNLERMQRRVLKAMGAEYQLINLKTFTFSKGLKPL